MVQGLLAAAVFVAAQRRRPRKISRRLYQENRRRLQAALRRQGAAALPAPVHPGGKMTAPSPHRGEGRGEGARTSQSEPPHPNPLPAGEREFALLRRLLFTAAVFLLCAYLTMPAHADAAFQTWLQSLWPHAQALGVSR